MVKKNQPPPHNYTHDKGQALTKLILVQNGQAFFFSFSNCNPSQVLVVSVGLHCVPHHDQKVGGMENVQIGCSRQKSQVSCHQICSLE